MLTIVSLCPAKNCEHLRCGAADCRCFHIRFVGIPNAHSRQTVRFPKEGTP
jgi:hypothetical protein